MFRTHFCVALICIGCHQQAFAQAKTLKAGSVEAYKFMAEQQNSAIMAEAEWNVAKKLCKFTEPPRDFKASSQEFSPENFQEGGIGYSQRWQFTVSSIVDKSNVILNLGSTSYWLEDFPTDGLADGESIRVVDPIQITKSRSYTTVTGSKRTVKTFKMISLDEFNKHREKLSEIEANKLRSERAAKCETFKTKSGELIVAQFIDHKKSKAILEDVDGKKLEIPTAELDDASAARVRELFKKKPKEPEPKKPK
jgi:hypothetical protein